MLVQHIMQQPVITTTADATLFDAYALMREKSIRHLPVTDASSDDGGALVGVVTDRDLRHATSPLHPSPVPAHAPVREAMTPNPITAGPLDPVEEAARILRERKIGCLPVLDGGALTGILTVTNLLDAVIELTGLKRPGARLAVSLTDEPGQMARLAARVAEAGFDIRSVLSYHEPSLAAAHESADAAHEASASNGTASDGLSADASASDEPRLRLILRVDTVNPRALAQELRADGFDVVWPAPKPV
jgi:acetoin utilization protein AcuB